MATTHKRAAGVQEASASSQETSREPEEEAEAEAEAEEEDQVEYLVPISLVTTANGQQHNQQQQQQHSQQPAPPSEPDIGEQARVQALTWALLECRASKEKRRRRVELKWRKSLVCGTQNDQLNGEQLGRALGQLVDSLASPAGRRATTLVSLDASSLRQQLLPIAGRLKVALQPAELFERYFDLCKEFESASGWRWQRASARQQQQRAPPACCAGCACESEPARANNQPPQQQQQQQHSNAASSSSDLQRRRLDQMLEGKCKSRASRFLVATCWLARARERQRSLDWRSLNLPNWQPAGRMRSLSLNKTRRKLGNLIPP